MSLSSEEVTEEVWDELQDIDVFRFSSRFPDDDTTIKFCEKYGLLPDRESLKNLPCSKCESRMYLVKQATGKLGYQLHCSKKKCPKSSSAKCSNCRKGRGKCQNECNFVMSPLEGTLFKNSKLSFTEILKLFYLFVIDVPNHFIINELHLNIHTVSKWLFFCRQVCRIVVQKFGGSIGGYGLTVEIGVIHLYRRKYHQGAVLGKELFWIIGGVCRENRKAFFEFSTVRDKQTLHDVIKRRVNPGTFVITDCCEEYSGLMESFPELGAHFLSSRTFKEVQTIDCGESGKIDFEVNANKMDCLWRDLKHSVGYFSKSNDQEGNNVSFGLSNMYMFLYKRNIFGEFHKAERPRRFQQFLSDIRDVYPSIYKERLEEVTEDQFEFGKGPPVAFLNTMSQEDPEMVKMKHLTESISASLIREFLARKGLQDLLKHFDSVLPRDQLSVSNRAHLIRLLHIEQLIIKDQESGPHFQTLLEVITKQLLYPNQQSSQEKAISSIVKVTTEDTNRRTEARGLSSSAYKCKESIKWQLQKESANNLKFSSMDFESIKEKPVIQPEKSSLDIVSSNLDDLEICDLSETDEQECTWDQSPQLRKTWTSNIICRSIAMDLKKLLFGSNSGASSFSDDWRGQAFHFNSFISYGFLQKKGGPCGLLAAVQAKLLLNLLFKNKMTQLQNDKKLFVTPSEKNEALAFTLGDILWQAGSGKSAIVATTSQLISNKAILESLSMYSFTSLQDLRNYFQMTIKQEMVNLILQGRAFSNVFDGAVSLNGFDLRGIQETSEIGFLSLFEHYNTCQVGENYKNPLFPVWVVLSESHFTVLFSTVYLDDSMKTFDLFYYDSLGRQETDIWLTLDLDCGSVDSQEGKGDMTPPLELCIHTKWKNVNIRWNGSEPLL